MLTTWLGKKGFRVQSVSSVKEAKQRMEGSFYDLVLSDLRLPDGDGIALLHWMTGYAEIQSAVLAMKSGAADYIAKPLNP